MIESDKSLLLNKSENNENFLQTWFNVVGDLDDFIFYDEEIIESQK